MNQNENEMELAELRAAWARLDEQVGADVARMEAITVALAEDRSRTLVLRAMWTPVIELVATLAGMSLAVLGLFQDGSAVFHGCLIGLLALFSLLIVSAVVQIAMIADVDPSGPVVATQRRLGQVRALRIFENKWMLLIAPVIWAPFLVVIVELTVKLALGREGTIFSSGFVLTNVLIGTVLTACLFWFGSWLAKRFPNSPVIREVLDDFAGRRLNTAREFLARLDGFERE